MDVPLLSLHECRDRGSTCGAQYRPLMTQNIVFTASLATLVPGEGYRQMFTTRPPVPYSLLSSLVLRY